MEHIDQTFRHLRSLDGNLRSDVKGYMKDIDKKLNVVYDKRRKYEESVNKLNEDSSDADFLNGKVHACKFYFEREIPRIDGWVNSLLSEKSVLLDISDSGF